MDNVDPNRPQPTEVSPPQAPVGQGLPYNTPPLNVPPDPPVQPTQNFPAAGPYPPQAYPQQSAPYQQYPQQPYPQQMAPQQAYPQQAAPQPQVTQQMYPQPNGMQPGGPQQPSPQPGYPQQPMPVQTYPQQPGPQQPYAQPVYPQQMAPQDPYGQQAYPQAGSQPVYPQQQYPQPYSPQQPYPQQQYPQTGYVPQGAVQPTVAVPIYPQQQPGGLPQVYPAQAYPQPGYPQQMPPSQGYTPAGGPEPTQAINPMPPEKPTGLADVLGDTQKRQKLEADLNKLGLSPAEVNRLLNANPNIDGARPAAPASPKVRTDLDTLQTYAASLAAASAAAQKRAVSLVSLGLPDLRASSPEEVRAAEPILRDANILRRRERYRDAEARCREALQYVPADAAALELLGDILQGVARVDEALAAYKRAMEADPKRSSSEKKYGDLLMRQQTWPTMDPEAGPKLPSIAALLSALFPGIGQFYNGDLAKGIVFLVLDLCCLYLLAWSPWGFAGAHRHHGISTALMASAILTGVVYVASVADAGISARAKTE